MSWQIMHLMLELGGSQSLDVDGGLPSCVGSSLILEFRIRAGAFDEVAPEAEGASVCRSP